MRICSAAVEFGNEYAVLVILPVLEIRLTDFDVVDDVEEKSSVRRWE